MALGLCCVEACNTGATSSKIKNEHLFLALKQGWKIIKTIRKIENKFH